MWFTILVFIFISVLFLGARQSQQKQKTVQLNMRAPDSGPVLMEPELSTKGEVVPAQAMKSQEKISVVKDQVKPSRTVKEMSIYFNYNDHSWEAHEVLGVPVGAQITDVTIAYQNSIKSCSSNSHDFLEVAYMSILKKRKND